jgi:hypothetical protein
LQFALSKSQASWAFRRLSEAHSLPSHKALRKTVTQIIQDEVGEEEARLYRGEPGIGTHHRNYVRPYSPTQVAKLDAALEKARHILFQGQRAL